MAQEWIETLATELREKGREAAENYGREQHRAGIIEAEGKVFFLALASALDQDFTEIRSQLQGSAVACETSVLKTSPIEVKLTRGRFPWFDATLKHDGPNVALDYAQDRGTTPDEPLSGTTPRTVKQFHFEVDRLDHMAITEAFGDQPQKFDKPEDFARHIIELLFKV
jgi:hypothetical protein